MDSLKLSNEQVQRLEELFYNTQAKQTQFRNDLALTRLALARELRSQNPDRKKIERLIREIEAIRTEMLQNRVNHWLQVREVLTPEQFQYLQARPFRRWPHPGYGPPRGFGPHRPWGF